MIRLLSHICLFSCLPRLMMFPGSVGPHLRQLWPTRNVMGRYLDNEVPWVHITNSSPKGLWWWASWMTQSFKCLHTKYFKDEPSKSSALQVPACQCSLWSSSYCASLSPIIDKDVQARESDVPHLRHHESCACDPYESWILTDQFISFIFKARL
jgi:hypothetical protein